MILKIGNITSKLRESNYVEFFIGVNKST